MRANSQTTGTLRFQHGQLHQMKLNLKQGKKRNSVNKTILRLKKLRNKITTDQTAVEYTYL